MAGSNKSGQGNQGSNRSGSVSDKSRSSLGPLDPAGQDFLTEEERERIEAWRRGKSGAGAINKEGGEVSDPDQTGENEDTASQGDAGTKFIKADPEPYSLFPIDKAYKRRGSVVSNTDSESVDSETDETLSVASTVIGKPKTPFTDLPIADDSDFPRWDDRFWFQRDDQYKKLASLFANTGFAAIYGNVVSLSPKTLAGHKRKRDHNETDAVFVEVGGQATVFGEGNDYFNKIHREFDYLREKGKLEEGDKFAWDQQVINFKFNEPSATDQDSASDLYITTSIFADKHGAFTSQTFLSKDEVEKLKREDQERCNKVAKAEIRSNAASLILGSLSSIGKDVFKDILDKIEGDDKESLKSFFGINKSDNLTFQNIKKFFESKEHTKFNPNQEDIDSILADNSGNKDKIIEILLKALGDDDRESKKAILTDFFNPENKEQDGQIPLSLRSREIASRLHRESRANSFEWKEIDPGSVKRFTDRYTGDEIFRNHDYEKMLREPIRQGSGAVTITNGFNANGTKDKFNVKISFDERENSDLDTAYIHIPGSNNLYVRARVCQKNGLMKYYENGKPKEMACLKGDIIIDRGTIFEMTQSGKYDPFPVSDLNDKHHDKAKEIEQNYNKLQIVAKSNYEVQKSYDKEDGNEIERERFDVATLVNGDSRDATYKLMHERFADAAENTKKGVKDFYSNKGEQWKKAPLYRKPLIATQVVGATAVLGSAGLVFGTAALGAVAAAGPTVLAAKFVTEGVDMLKQKAAGKHQEEQSPSSVMRSSSTVQLRGAILSKAA